MSTRYDPATEYIAVADEWTALLTLAAEVRPAQAISLGNWRADHFADATSSAAFAQLATAQGSVLLETPAGVAESLAGGALDATALATLRARLAALAQLRALAELQRNLGKRLGAVDTQGDLGGIPALASATRSALDAVAALGDSRRVASATLGALTTGYWERVSRRAEAMPTGLRALDEALGGGLQAGRLITLLGAPGSGKTTLANQWAEHIADAGRPVVYLTLEDASDTLLAKTLARVGGLEYGAVLHGYARERSAISKALADVAQRKSAQRLLYVEDVAGMTLGDIREITAGHLTRYDASHTGGAGVLVVDYLQRLARAQRGPDARDDLRIVVGRLTEDLRALARDLDCCVIAIASMNRASGYGKNGDESALASAKEAGDIEYATDVLMALTNDPKAAERRLSIKHESRILRIDKNRLGETRQIALDWWPTRQVFTEIADK